MTELKTDARLLKTAVISSTGFNVLSLFDGNKPYFLFGFCCGL